MPVIVKCTLCNTDVERLPSQAKKHKRHFCSRNCQYEFKSDRVKINCAICGLAKMIIPSQIKEKNYCSKECADKGLSKAVTKKCSNCKKEITIKLSNIRKENFCSVKCSRILFLGENNPRYNPNLTEEERRKERNNSSGYKEWRTSVYIRDKHTCQCCGSRKSGNLNAHHIYNYSEYKELRMNLDNGITLCVPCHKAFHSKYGYRNNNENQLEEFLNMHKMTTSIQTSEIHEQKTS